MDRTVKNFFFVVGLSIYMIVGVTYFVITSVEADNKKEGTRNDAIFREYEYYLKLIKESNNGDTVETDRVAAAILVNAKYQKRESGRTR